MKLSVALCTYNGSEFIEQQINSILNETILINKLNTKLLNLKPHEY